MKKQVVLSVSLALVAALSSCSGKLGALSADNFNVTPNPLETNAGVVPATITGQFPEKYMKKKAVVTVTPVLKYNGTSMAGTAATFQGEKVQGNNQTINYKVGGNYTMRTAYPYEEAMAKAELWLQFNARVGKKTVNVPEVKVADGVVATAELYKTTLAGSQASMAKDAFQHSIEQKQTATIQFLLGQANLRASELKKDNIKEFVAKLSEIQGNEKNVLNNVEVSAYASPDGKYSFNEKLAGKREDVSVKYVNKELKNASLEANVDSKYTAEDWEGFQELVAQSSIQDKDLIVRVLSMYQDPEEREREIRNIATVYKELADGILPQLRRARLTANYEVIGRTDSEIAAQLKADAKQLSVEELLYGASILSNAAEKEAYYKAAMNQYGKDARAFNNMGALAFQKGDLTTAANYFAQAQKIAANSAEANANLGLIALIQGKKQEAAQLLSKGSGADGLAEAMGALYVAQGQYAQAANTLKGSMTNTAALAQILNKDYAGAAATLAGIKAADATTDYLKAILSARTGDSAGVSTYLKKAAAASAALKARAKTDLEFAKFASAVSAL